MNWNREDWMFAATIVAVLLVTITAIYILNREDEPMQCVKLEIWRPGNWDCKTPDVSVDEPDFTWDEDEVTITTKNPDETVTQDSYNIIGARVRTLNKPG